MSTLHITDIGNSKVQISWQAGSAIPRSCPEPIPFANPLTAQEREDLRWYLEGYLQFPYGAERWKAEQVEKKMEEWGKSIFKRIFPKCDFDPDPRSLYQEAVRIGLEDCEICITSEDASFLNIPWELVYDPTPGRGYLALLLRGLYRHRTGHKIEVPPTIPVNAPFRILLVIARPYGKRDVPLGMIARPMLEALRAQRARIEVEVLRPPTFDNLQRLLNERRGYYQLVHFDGHGVFAQPSDSHLTSFGVRAETGHLVFEKEDGSPHVVSALELGQVLATAHLPLFVLNACQSAIEGDRDPFSSVATQLIASGAKGAVAMSYSVYATTAARFMQRFYELLIAHTPLSEAVAAARRKLWSEKDHETSAGAIELQDWMVPVLYQQEYTFVPIPETIGESKRIVDLAEVESKCKEGIYGFIGRDSDILRIERAFRESTCVLVTGMSGIGKTELAYGFARWFAETGGCPGGVFVSSFKGGGNMEGVLGDILGRATDWSRYTKEEQKKEAIRLLRENPCHLIWDNFETVSGYPEGTEPLSTEKERAELAEFLQALRGSKSRVLITTRKQEEKWLGVVYSLIELKGLAYPDAVLLANRILRTIDRQPDDFKGDENYPKLLRLLHGHPRAMGVVLPQLRLKPPAAVIEDMQHSLEAYPDLLDASSEYAFSQMSEKARKHLPILGLFTSFVLSDIIKTFVSSGDDRPDVYRAVIGEALDGTGWEDILNEAAQNGLISRLQNRIYQLHPSLPPFLRQHLRKAVGEEGVRKLDTEFVKFYAALAAQLDEDVQNANQNVVSVIGLEEHNFLRALRIVVKTEQWALAQGIVQTLYEFYECLGRFRERSALCSSLLDNIGREISIDATRSFADLWMFLLCEGADEALNENRLEDAKKSYNMFIHYLQTLSDPEVEPKIAVGYYLLGRIAQERQRFDEAEQWYRKSLEINERLGSERGATGDYQALGMIAQEQQQFDKAEQWYRKSLEINEGLGLERDAASDYQALGMIAWEQQQFDKAEQWYRKSLEINERLGLEKDAASDYHHLGMIAHERQQFDVAEQWYRKALEIKEKLGLERNAASDYHHLGMIAHERQQFDVAEQWYRKALEIKEGLGLERYATTDYHQLGIIAQMRQQFDKAEEWHRKALEISERLGLERYVADEYHELGIIAQMRQQFDKAEEWHRKALEIREGLGLERDAASDYHELGIIAEDRQQFDKAERCYRKTLEILEKLGHPPLKVNTLALLGVLCLRQERYREAVAWCAKAFEIAIAYQMQVATRILLDLRRLLEEMGEEDFASAWREATGKEPRIDEIRKS